jgi:phenylalanyl-tRNA synthetase beta chain
MSNSLTSAKSNEITGIADSVEILNPLSIELQVLRSQMISSGLESIAYNINRKNASLNLYEWGNTYHKTESANTEFWHLSMFMTGNTHKEHWNVKPVEKTFFHLKSIVDQIVQRLGLTSLKSSVLTDANLDGFAYLSGKTEIIKVSSLHKSLLKSFDISQPVYYADFNMTEIFELIKKRKKTYKEPSKFPEVRRDLSMLVDQAVSFESLKKVAMQAEQRLLKNVDVFDVYQGEKLPAGKKSYALSFVLLDEEKTLQDQAIDGVMNKLIAAYEKEVAAEIRKAF